ncbi:hypothetical protein DFH29DRAFT_883757 [Suillus ampliporus]|nr:hypothetical protein DFH29DRAFT_883757 [Suillus ampliporus]
MYQISAILAKERGLRMMKGVIEILAVLADVVPLRSAAANFATNMKLGHAKTLSPGKNSPSHRHQESYEHTQRADKAMGSVAKKRAIRRATTGDIAQSFSKGSWPSCYGFPYGFISLPTKFHHALIGWIHARWHQIWAMRKASKSLGRNDQGETSFIEAEAGKDILKCGLQSMLDDAIQKATLAKQASHEIRRLHIMLTAWEIEEAECHVELLHELQRSNVEGYLDATHEATWFKRFILDRSLAEVKDDFDFNRTVYPNDLASFATADEQLNQLESHTEECELVLSKEELAKELKALIVEGGEESETDGSLYNSNAS